MPRPKALAIQPIQAAIRLREPGARDRRLVAPDARAAGHLLERHVADRRLRLGLDLRLARRRRRTSGAMTKPGRPSIDCLELVVGLGALTCAPRGTSARVSKSACWIVVEQRRARCAARPSIGVRLLLARVAPRRARPAPSRCPWVRSRAAAARRASPTRRTSSRACTPRARRAITRMPAAASSLLIASALGQHGLLPVAARDRARSPPDTARRWAAGRARCRRRAS